jgi:tetratricopeptide (TPR) repeat protein
VVINQNFVATNCHVLANARGANITKLHENYMPVAIRTDWKHDVCLLRFEGLPFKSVAIKDSASLNYEQAVFAITYPYDNQVPQTSYGNVKALYPYEGSLIIRTSAAFAMGSSGGALFDEDFNLVGLTTFKSPGHYGYFYALPVEWIKRLLDAPDTQSLAAGEDPFWSLAEEQRPYFMQVVIPFQTHQWQQLERIAMKWSEEESSNSEAWYYLGMAEYNQQHLQQASMHFARALSLNQKHTGALYQTAIIANEQGHQSEALRIGSLVQALDEDEGAALSLIISPQTPAITN